MSTIARIQPKLDKGMLISFPDFNPVDNPFFTQNPAAAIAGGLLTGTNISQFQFNPAKIGRRLSPTHCSDGEAKDKGPSRVMDLPKESISLTAEFDATDQMNDPDDSTSPELFQYVGLYPQLSALELMLYPSFGWLGTSIASKFTGITTPAENIPVVIFVWGSLRILPVRITSYSIEETLFNQNLAPIRASVNISLDVLRLQDIAFDSAGLSLLDPGFLLLSARYIKKQAEAKASLASLTNPFAFS